MCRTAPFILILTLLFAPQLSATQGDIHTDKTPWDFYCWPSPDEYECLCMGIDALAYLGSEVMAAKLKSLKKAGCVYVGTSLPLDEPQAIAGRQVSGNPAADSERGRKGFIILDSRLLLAAKHPHDEVYGATYAKFLTVLNEEGRHACQDDWAAFKFSDPKIAGSVVTRDRAAALLVWLDKNTDLEYFFGGWHSTNAIVSVYMAGLEGFIRKSKMVQEKREADAKISDLDMLCAYLNEGLPICLGDGTPNGEKGNLLNMSSLLIKLALRDLWKYYRAIVKMRDWLEDTAYRPEYLKACIEWPERKQDLDDHYDCFLELVDKLKVSLECICNAHDACIIEAISDADSAETCACAIAANEPQNVDAAAACGNASGNVAAIAQLALGLPQCFTDLKNLINQLPFVAAEAMNGERCLLEQVCAKAKYQEVCDVIASAQEIKDDGEGNGESPDGPSLPDLESQKQEKQDRIEELEAIEERTPEEEEELEKCREELQAICDLIAVYHEYIEKACTILDEEASGNGPDWAALKSAQEDEQAMKTDEITALTEQINNLEDEKAMLESAKDEETEPAAKQLICDMIDQKCAEIEALKVQRLEVAKCSLNSGFPAIARNEKDRAFIDHLKAIEAKCKLFKQLMNDINSLSCGAVEALADAVGSATQPLPPECS